VNGREKYLARKAYKRPVGQFTQQDNVRDFARSGLGQNYFAIQDLQRQAPSFQTDDPRIDDLKQRRRLWNRSQKYPAGEMLGRTPQQQMEQYTRLSGDLRERAKPVYDKMYPLTGLYHDYVDKGGTLGLIGRGFKDFAGSLGKMGKDIFGATGIAGLVDSDKDEQDEYVAKTFGFYPSDVHPARDTRIEDGPYIEPWADETPIPNIEVEFGPFGSENPIEETELKAPYEPSLGAIGFGIPFDYDFSKPETRTIPGIPEPMPLIDEPLPLDEPTGRTLADVIDEPLPFDDADREYGILLNQGLVRDINEPRLFEKEYRDYIEKTADMDLQYNLPPTTYEEFVRAYKKMYQGKPHVGLR
jgi:hypothetical protein